MNSETATYDVLILGGGVAACAMAITLKNVDPLTKVVIVERKSAVSKEAVVPFRIGESLSPQTSKILQQLGIWESFLAMDGRRSYGTSAAWGSSKLHHNEFIYSPFGYGWHLDRVKFDQFMIAEARERGVDFLFDTQLHSFEMIQDRWTSKGKNLEKKIQINAKFIADATGRKAAFASHQGAKKVKLDKLVGIYNYYEIKSEAKEIPQGTLIESDKNGWWYSATLPTNHLVIAYMTDADVSSVARLKNEVEFAKKIKRSLHTKARVTSASSIGPPQLGAAHSQILDTITGKHWLALGDAAMTFDPLSSLGIYKALSTSIFGAYAALDSVTGNEIGLQKYDQIMRAQYRSYLNKRTIHYTEEKRFSNQLFWERRTTTKNQSNSNQLLKTTNYETAKVY